MLVKNIKIVIVAVTLLMFLCTVIWWAYSVKTAAQSQVIVKVLERQGEANDRENLRATTAVQTEKGILTESDASFTVRLQQFESSTGYSVPYETESLRYTKPHQSENISGRYPPREKAKDSYVLPQLDLLRETPAKLLQKCQSQIILTGDTSPNSISVECLD